MYDAWIVGSAADPSVAKPHDYDVIVSWSQWAQVATLIPLSARPNSFGGWVCMEDEIRIDVWPGDLSSFLTIGMAKAIWHPRSGKRFIQEKEQSSGNL